MNGRMQQQADRVHHGVAAHHLPLVIDLHQVRHAHVMHRHTDRVDPKVVRQLGVAHGDVAQQPLGVAAPAEDAAGSGQPLQHVRSLGLLGSNTGCERLAKL